MVATTQATGDESALTVDHPLARVERPLTEDDFWALPDDENRYEIIGGELFMTPPPSAPHERLSQHLNAAFYQAIEVKELGWVFTALTGVRLGVSDVPQPDLIIVSSERSDEPTSMLIETVPELVVEITSPSTRRRDRVKKRLRYQEAGIPEYWIVDPMKRTVEILTLEDGQYREAVHDSGIARSRVFPLIQIDVARLFSGKPYVAATTPNTTG